MNGIVFYIGLGIGLAAACGLRAFLPALLAGALASSGALGVSFARDPFRFLQDDWWLLAVTVALVLSYALQILLALAPIIDPSDRGQPVDPLGASLAGLGLGVGALLFAGTLAAHGDAWWPGLLGGFLAAALAQRATWPVITRVRARLGASIAASSPEGDDDASPHPSPHRPRRGMTTRPGAGKGDRGAREALTLYLDAAALLLAALVAALHPLGYVVIVGLAWFAWRGRARREEKYAGLRILRR